MDPLKILVTGCRGRMGRAVIGAASHEPQVTVQRQIDIEDSLMAAMPECESVIDFSFHAFTRELVRGQCV